MPLDGTNTICALAILGPRQIDKKQKVLGIVAAGLVPGIVGLAVPLIIAQRSKGQRGPGTGVVVGTGVAQPTQSVVPDLTGESIDDAAATLKKVQLTLGDVTNALSTDDEKDKVVTQDPEAEKVVAIGSPVSVVVGSGPA